MRTFLCFLLSLLLSLPCAAAEIPILMYHHFQPAPSDSPEICSAGRFREHLEALRDAGYTSVTFRDLLAYADGAGTLPDKPVLLTADDGYGSVTKIACPLLKEFGMTMSAAVVGSRMGRQSGIPHFSLTEAEDPALELISHTWDLHGPEGYGVLTERGGLHPGFVPDALRMRDLPGLCGTVFVYPYGKHSGESEAVLALLGYRITVTTCDGIAEILPGMPESLRCLPRIGMHDGITGEALLARLEGR